MRLAVTTLGLAALLPGCGSGDDTLIVMAASSLTDVLAEMENSTALTDVGDIDTVFAGSTTLVAQLREGAAADLLLTANRDAMTRAASDGSVAGRPVVFATNSLVLAVAPGNPGAVAGLDDLARTDLQVGLCAAAVPCGTLAVEAAAELGVDIAVDTEEPNVRALAAKIVLGEIDVGLVYATDAAALGLDTVAVPGLSFFVNEYVVATVDEAPSDAVARLASTLVHDAVARAILSDAGFGAPPPS